MQQTEEQRQTTAATPAAPPLGNAVQDLQGGKIRLPQEYVFKIPKEKEKLLLDLQCYNHMKTICTSAKKQKIAWADVLLSVSFLFWGVFLSALLSQTAYTQSLPSILAYSISPFIGVGTLVGAIALKVHESCNMHHLADRVLDYIELGVDGITEEENPVPQIEPTAESKEE